MLESVIEKYLVCRIKATGGESRKVSFIGRRGSPDRIVLYPNGVCAWIELKAPNGVLSKAQRTEHKMLTSLGQDVYILDSKEDIDTLLLKLSSRPNGHDHET